MNTLKISIIAILVSAISFNSAMAGIQFSKEQTNTEQVGFLSNSTNDRVTVSIDRENDQPYEITIADLKGNTFHNEVVEGDGVFTKRYDLEELVDGEYVISVEGQGSELASQNFIKR